MSTKASTADRSPILVVVRGRAGSGKSTVAKGVAERLGFSRVDYDAEMLAAYQRYGVRTTEVRELARQEGRIASGHLAAAYLGLGHSAVCDANIRDLSELSELTSYDADSPAGAKLLVVRLEVGRSEARKRKLTTEWNEFRIDPRAAARYFEQMWNEPFKPIVDEVALVVADKAADTILDATCRLIETARADHDSARSTRGRQAVTSDPGQNEGDSRGHGPPSMRLGAERAGVIKPSHDQAGIRPRSTEERSDRERPGRESPLARRRGSRRLAPLSASARSSRQPKRQ
jgi:predicted kinase